MHRTFFFLIAFLLLSFAQAQENPRIGISSSVQSGQFSILVPVWVAKKIILAPAIGIKTASGIGKEFAFGLVPRYYFKREKLSPYVGLNMGIISYNPKVRYGDKEKTLDSVVGFAVGGEYFFDSHFSMGVEAQGNISISDKESIRFGNPGGVNFNTATAIHATVYF